MYKKNGYMFDAKIDKWMDDNEGKYSAYHISLYHHLRIMNNRAGWREQFEISRDLCMRKSGIKSPTTFAKILHDLENWGFIKIISTSKNKYTNYVIMLISSKNDFTTPLNDEVKPSKNDFTTPLNDEVTPLNDEVKPLNDEVKSGNAQLTGDSECLKLYKTILNNICVDHDENSKPKSKAKSKKFIPPTLNEFTAYFIDHDYPADLAKRAFNGYSVADWVDSQGKPIKNWRQKCFFVWFKPENKANNFKQPQKQFTDEIQPDQRPE